MRAAESLALTMVSFFLAQFLFAPIDRTKSGRADGLVCGGYNGLEACLT